MMASMLKDDFESQYKPYFLTASEAWRKMEQQRQDDMAKMLEAFRTPLFSSAALKSLEFPIVSTLEQSMNRFKDIEAGYQSAIDKAIKAFKTPVSFGFEDALKKINQPIDFGSVFQSAIDQHQSHLKASLDSFVRPIAFDATAQLFKKLADDKTMLHEICKSLNVDDIGVDKNEFENDLIEANLALSEAMDEASFLDVFVKLKPYLKPLFWILMIFLHITGDVAKNIASNILTPHVENYLKGSDEPDRQKIKRIKDIANSFGDLDIEHLRFITRDNVILRAWPSAKADVVDQFSLGDIVVVVSKDQSWTEVTYQNEDGQAVHGWVFTRYTARFTKTR